MPCYDPPGAWDGDGEEMRRRNDELTEKLCTACRWLDESGHPIPPNLKQWWADHKKFDKARNKH